jgi:Phytanoyl-CoA dioxygenase (PhyH)
MVGSCSVMRRWVTLLVVGSFGSRGRFRVGSRGSVGRLCGAISGLIRMIRGRGRGRWSRVRTARGRRFVAAANTPRLYEAFDTLVGEGRWLPRTSLGGFVIRFPGDEPSVVDGWHVDVSFAGPGSTADDYMTWRANLGSRERALLMFFLLSDVGEDDAPTRLRVGSHLDVARILAPHGADGLDARELARQAAATGHRPTVHATGRAGDVYLCHPFLVHAGQPHRGRTPRFLGQPKLWPAEPLRLDRGGRRVLSGRGRDPVRSRALTGTRFVSPFP